MRLADFVGSKKAGSSRLRVALGAAAAFTVTVAVAAAVGSTSFEHAPDAAKVDAWLHRAADVGDRSAEAALQRWSDRGNRDATHALVQLLEHRPDAANGLPQVQLLRRAAQDGDGWAATELANRSLRGLGSPATPMADASPQQITDWYRQGAATGVPEAERMLGVLLLDGRAGVTAAPVEAISWFEKAANHGDANAMFLLANALRSGQGGPQDEPAALRWYRRAADADFAPALQTLALAYRHGELGLPVDRAEERLMDHEAAEALAHSRVGR